MSLNSNIKDDLTDQATSLGHIDRSLSDSETKIKIEELPMFKFNLLEKQINTIDQDMEESNMMKKEDEISTLIKKIEKSHRRL